MKPWIKICGITRLEDADRACALGAHALGFIFHEASPRNVEIKKAHAIVDALWFSSVDRVAVVVDPTMETLDEILSSNHFTHLQLHGDEAVEFCEEAKSRFQAVELIKAFRVPELNLAGRYPVSYDLIDHQTKTERGGTGKVVDWTAAKAFRDQSRRKLILAGGLGPDNIVQAINTVKPYGIDLSSGVESSPGIKSAEKLEALFSALRKAGD